MQACAEKLGGDGLRMRIAAVAEDFSESGMNFNTGWGYLPGRVQAIHMMDFYDSPGSTTYIS